MRNVYLVGMMGSGKSFWGKKLAGLLNYTFVDLDDEITLRTGVSIPQIFVAKGEAAFRQLETETLADLSRQQGLVVSTGGGTPCFGHNISVMKESGEVIWLNPSVHEMASRIWPGRERRPLIAEAQSLEEVEKILNQLLEKRSPFYGQAQMEIRETEIDLENLVTWIKLQEKR